jgi:UPF0176 protein
MQKIILFYKFTPLPDPQAVRLWQQALATGVNLKGRILISGKGINATLGGEVDDLSTYIAKTSSYDLLRDIAFKWSDGGAEDFPRLSVKVRSETVTLGLPEKVEVNEGGVIGGGQRIKPGELDDFLAAHPDAVLFDGRNRYESAIGRFKGAVTPEVDHFRDFPAEIRKSRYQELKTKPVVTYCTGGIRCEVLTSLLRTEGFEEVYQLDGGIVEYGKTKADEGLWEGKCFVFDRRLSIGFSQASKDIGRCSKCAHPTSRYVNCANKACNKLILVCDECRGQTTCSLACADKALSAV